MYKETYLEPLEPCIIRRGKFCSIAWSELQPSTKINMQRRSLCRKFESLWTQLSHHRASSENEQSFLKARLTDLAHLYCGEEIDSHDFAFHGECFRVLNSLHSNENIVITKLDKGSGVVILNKNTFINKMLVILDDPSKFEKIGPTSSNDNTANIELKLQKRLLELFKEDSIPKIFVPPDHKDPECMVYPKRTKQTYRYDRYYLRQARPIMSSASG